MVEIKLSTWYRSTYKDIQLPVSTLRNQLFALRDSVGHRDIKLDEVHVAKLRKVLGLRATAHPREDVKIMFKEAFRQSPTNTSGAAACYQNRLLLNRCGRHVLC